jgi:hypothetical protein
VNRQRTVLRTGTVGNGRGASGGGGRNAASCRRVRSGPRAGARSAAKL